MSKHSSPGSPTNTSESMKKYKQPTDAVDSEESPTATIRADFVLMSTPDKFKDNPPPPSEDDSNVPKAHVSTSSYPEVRNLDSLLVADTSMEAAPLHLQNLLKHFESSALGRGELLFLLIYAVALESGFVCQEEYERNGDCLSFISSTTSFHSKNVLRLSLLPPKYSKTEDSSRFSLKLCSIVDLEVESTELIFGLLVGFVTGDFLIATFSPANSMGTKGFSIALSIGRYVMSVPSKNKPTFQRFRKLDELSILLRDKVFVPMRNQHLLGLGASVYPSLEGMPPELYDNILQHLNNNQLQVLANVNKALYNLTVCSKYKLKFLQSSRPSTNESSHSYLT